MPSYYTIAQYSPSPISDERINFGVLVFGDGKVRSHFVKNWDRIRHFGAEIGLLGQFVKEAEGLSEGDLKRMVETYTYSIRFTEVRGSLLSPIALLSDVAGEFLIDPPKHKAEYRYRRDAAQLAHRALSAALRASVHGDAKNYLRADMRIDGQKGTHYFDVGLHNKNPRVGARGLSFELPEGPELSKEVNSTTLTIEDVLASLPGMQVSVVVLPPQKTNDTFKRAMDTFQNSGAQVVREDGVEAWAKRSVNEFVSQHAANRPNAPAHTKTSTRARRSR